MTPKILLTAIFKDDSEVEMIERMLKSFMPHMAGLAVALTGTSGQFDKLKKLIDGYGGRYVICAPDTHPTIYSTSADGKVFFSNFAEARNASFALASTMQKENNYDWWCWADADDMLLSGAELAKAAERGIEQKLDSIFFTYWYAVLQNSKGDIEEVVIDHLRERLLRPNIFKWVSRLHEVAVPIDGNYQPRHSAYDFLPNEGRSCVWVHLPGAERVNKALMRNLEILEVQAQEEKRQDPRTLFYLAKTYYDLAEPVKLHQALDLLTEYRSMSGWAEERSHSWEYTGNILCRFNRHTEALDAYYNAVKEYPIRHMPYLLLAKEYQEIGRLDECDFWLTAVLRMDPPKARTTIGNPLEIKIMAAQLKYNQALKKSQIEDAIYWLKICQQLTRSTDDGMLKTLTDAHELNQAAIWVFNYAKWLKDHGHSDRIKPLLDAVAPEMKGEQFVSFIANEVTEPTIWPKGSIVYFAGSAFAEWNPQTALKDGIGGSERAVLELSREWVKNGYSVTVYANVTTEGEFDGVSYRHYNTINFKDKFDTLILWRNPQLLDLDISAGRIYLDLHDVASQIDFTDPRMAKVDKVFFKSDYHRNMVPKLPNNKAEVIANGI